MRALVPDRESAALDALLTAGIEATTFPMSQDMPRILADGRTIRAIEATLTKWRPSAVLGCGAKTMLVSALAAKSASVERRVGLFTEMPADLTVAADASLSWRWRRLMRPGFKALDASVFHNHDHLERLAAARVLPKGLAVSIVSGAGVDLDHNQLQPLPPADGGINFVMIARKSAVKGVIDFCRAAKRVLRQAPATRFVVAGPEGDIDLAALAEFAEAVQFTGDQLDVRPLIGAAHVVVVPSWDEGMPRILLEALAAGRPVIASDIPGCREAIDERVNGVLVPPRDAKALAAAMMSFVERPDLNAAMGRASRSKAERRFDVRSVNTELLRVLGL